MTLVRATVRDHAWPFKRGGNAMAKEMHKTPNLDALESGPWPSFVTG
jgi:hypothetical protein